MAIQFDDFVIHFRPYQDDYMVYSESDNGGDPPEVVLSRTMAGKFILLGQGIRSHKYTFDEVRQYGKDLFNAIFQSSLRLAYIRALTTALNQKRGLRLVLKFDESHVLQEIPWEILHDTREFIAIDPLTPIVRYMRQGMPIRPRQKQPPLRVLFTTACPKGVQPLNLSTEEAFLREALKTTSDHIQLVVERNISLDRLHHVLLRAQNIGHPFHIWHHAGHGGILPNERFVLALEEAGQQQLVELSQIEPLAAVCPDLTMIVLNVCHGAAPRGLAAQLAQVNVPVVIGFHNAVKDAHALIFARELYATLLDAPPEMAVGLVRNRLYIENKVDGGLDWMLPIVYSRSTSDTFLAQSQTTTPESAMKEAPGSSNMKVKIGTMKAENPIIARVINVGRNALSLPSTNNQMDVEIDHMEAGSPKIIDTANFSDAEALAALNSLNTQLKELDDMDAQ